MVESAAKVPIAASEFPDGPVPSTMGAASETSTIASRLNQMTPRQPTLDSIWIQIQNNRVDTIDGRSFVPPTSLSTIFTSTAIAGAVAELSCAAEDRLGLADAIRHSGIPTFAVLVWMSQPSLIVVFRRKRCLDRLPLDEETARQAAGKYAPTFVRLQWEFLPYHFQRDQDVEIGREILPFVRDLGPLMPGGFGDIHMLEIHPSLQDFAPCNVSSLFIPCILLPFSLAPPYTSNFSANLRVQSERVVVVRKTLRGESDVSDEARLAMFINEKRCLRLINHPPHPNIVPLLTAYAHGRDCCLLFPRLDMDLKAFLSHKEPYGDFRRRFTYFSSLHGLASALERAHGIRVRADGAEFDGFAYHHDLRPSNVLVSRDTFLLADFGMGRVRELEDRSTTHFKALAGDYAAPECMDEDFARLDVGRAVDVWAFGCLVCEVMTYAYLGVDGLKKFRAGRKLPRPSGEVVDSLFCDLRGDIKTVVREWINLIATTERQPSLGEPLRDLILSIFSPVNTRPRSPTCDRAWPI